MSTIIQKQYETAKEILKSAEFYFNFYKTCGKTQEQFDEFYTIATSLLTIVGGVYVAGKVYQSTRDYNIEIIGHCRQMFAAYEAELMQAGLIPSKWEQILADVEPTEPAETIEYTAEQEAQMWHEHMKQMDYDPQF
jgi:GH35 family endo-1,4-beta-xylanase